MPKSNIEIKNLTKRDLKELSSKKIANGVVFSLYLGIRSGKNFRSEANSIILNTIRKIRKNSAYSEKEKKKIMEAADRIKTEVKLLKLPKETRSLAIFCSLSGLCGIYHVPSYMASRLIIKRGAYIHPLVKAMEKYPRYIVVVLERDKAKLFDIFLGEIKESSEILCDDVPQKINAARASWKGLRETKVQRHIEEHINRHLKNVAKEASKYLKKNKPSFLIIGAHRELMEKFEKVLDQESARRIIGSYHIIPGYNISRIKSKTKEVIEEYEKNLEKKLLENVFNMLSKKKRLAVMGIDSVLKNFYLHNVEEFIIGRDYKELGYICPQCQYVSSYLKSCPKCKIKMSKVSDIADEIIKQAVLSNIKVKHLLYSHGQFDKFGIGAFLKSKT
jgi:peptide chain release factor subunit 1